MHRNIVGPELRHGPADWDVNRGYIAPGMIPFGTDQMAIGIRRREFISVIGGMAARPLAARAQQPNRVRRIGVLMNTANSSLGQTWFAAFAQGLQQLGWENGRNVQIDTRWGAGNTERFRQYAAELVALAPDVILATANSIVGDLLRTSRTVPIVFVTTIDPSAAAWSQPSTAGRQRYGFYRV